MGVRAGVLGPAKVRRRGGSLATLLLQAPVRSTAFHPQPRGLGTSCTEKRLDSALCLSHSARQLRY
eukprot:918477-Rhodomonas_salina.1